MGFHVSKPICAQQVQLAEKPYHRNYRPTDSDMEQEEDSDDEDPASWFDDDQDDGRKGQNIVDPDTEDLSDIIRVDASRIRYSTFYEPRDEGE